MRPIKHSDFGERGSALLVTLGILALLAIMGTTFVTMMRADSRMTARYVDDVQCELLARGLLEYCRGILADDLDRSMKITEGSTPDAPRIANRYENRDTAAPILGRIAGLNTNDSVGNANEERADKFIRGTRARYGLRVGIPPSNDFWLCLPSDSRSHVHASYSAMTSSWHHHSQTGSFRAGSREVRRLLGALTWGQTMIVYEEPQRWDDEIGDYAHTLEHITVTVDTGGVGYDIWVGMCQNGIDDNGDGIIDPYSGQDGVSEENDIWYDYYDYVNTFLTPGGSSVYLQGPKFTGDKGLPGGRYWRTALRVGMPEGMWFNLNLTGNMEKYSQDLQTNMDGKGLRTRMVQKPPTDWHGYGTSYTDNSDYGQKHLGLLGFRGYSGEEPFPAWPGNQSSPDVLMKSYNAVCYSPLQVSLREMFYDSYIKSNLLIEVDEAAAFGDLCDVWAEKLIAARYGGGNTPRAASGYARFRPGWRADGGSYYVIPSPDNPGNTDSYFGPEEALERATPAYMTGPNVGNPAGSRLFNTSYYNVFGRNRTETQWATMLMRGTLGTLSRDTILRGKIWWAEEHGAYRDADSSIGAYQLPGNLRNKPGEWRHLSILKRVNLNILGATDTPDYLNWPDAGFSANGMTVKKRWARKQHYEQDRCYYMIKGALKWSGNLDAQAAKKACTLIASLTDMIDRDQDETKYEAPDGSGQVGWGVERFPVINEIGLEIKDGTIRYFRVELFNPTENIPWLPDADEAIDLTPYELKILCPGKTSNIYALTPLDRMGIDRFTFDEVQGKCTEIPMSGVNGWSSKRYVHVNLDDKIKADFTTDDLAKGIQIELIKNTSHGKRLVDRAAKWDGDNRDNLLLATYNDDNSRVFSAGGTWVGIYRRIDPLNARTHECSGRTNQGSVVHSTRSQGLYWAGSLGNTNMYPSYLYFFNVDGKQKFDYNTGWCRDLKVPDTDLPSIGWIGEAVIYSYMDPDHQEVTLTELHDNAQKCITIGRNTKYEEFANQIDTKCKFNLFKPFGDSRNLHILDIFTCWDPSNDGEDNDGDGAIDEDDEVVVHGRIDINLCSAELMNQIFGIGMKYAKGKTSHRRCSYISGTRKMSCSYPRGLSGRSDAADWPPSPSGGNRQRAHPGPRETIGDMIRWDRLSPHPGWTMGGSYPYDAATWEELDADRRAGAHYNKDSGQIWYYDDDGDGKKNEIDEGDALFTWFANLLTTRNNVFTVEVIAELTEPPYHPGRAMSQHRAYKISSKDIHARKHLLAVLDRTPTFKVQADGKCDFTGPVRIMVMRWAQTNK